VQRGTLVISKNVKCFPLYKKLLEDFGFINVTLTDVENEGLNFIIREKKPDLLIIEASFYQRSTPYMMGELLRIIPELKYTAAVALDDYCEELAMCFITNHVDAYVRWYDGIEEFKKGMGAVRDGEHYISPAVLERIQQRDAKITPAGRLFQRQIEVMRLICSGLQEDEAADNLHVSRSTIVKTKTNIFRKINVRNPVELVLNVLEAKIFSLEELYNWHKNFVVSPLPDKNKKRSNEEAI